MSEQFDLLVIGGGPGGYVCAIRQHNLVSKQAVLSQEELLEVHV